MRNKYLFVILSILLGFTEYSAQITLNAETQRTDIGINDRVVVQYILTIKNRDIKNIGDMKLPIFNNFQVLQRNVIQERNYINGNTEIHLGYELVLKPSKGGIHKLGKATVEVDGKTYYSPALSFKVSGNNKNQKNNEPPSLGNRIRDAYLTLDVSDKNPYQNEGIVAVLKLYTKRVDILQSATRMLPPNFHGFTVQPIKINNNYQQEYINGDVYIVADIAAFVMFPNHSGENQIDPFTLVLTLSDGFFDEQEVNLRSASVKIHTKELPAQKPKGFYGVVGEYKLNVSTNKKQLKANEALTVNVEVSGKGNLGLIKVPEIIPPVEIEKYAPKEKASFSPTLEGYVGKISSTTILVPQYGGNFNIGFNPLVYFDPKEGKYKSLGTDSLKIAVLGPKFSKKTDSLKQNKEEQENNTQNSSFLQKQTQEIKNVLAGREDSNILVWIIVGLIIIGCGFLFLFGIIRKKDSKHKTPTDLDSEDTIKASPKDIIKTQENFAPLRENTPEEKLNYEEDLHHLRNLSVDDSKHSEFYTGLENLLQKATLYNLKISETNFNTEKAEEKLAIKFGDDFANQWKELIIKSQIEKYSPLFDSHNNQEDLLSLETILKTLIP